MKNVQSSEQSKQGHVAEEFSAVDLGAPFQVILHNCVEVQLDKTEKIVSYKIPDLDGLLRTVVMSRILHPRKLNGPDIKFIRKAISLKQKDLAGKIGISPEHLSRCEGGDMPLAPSTEKLLRVYMLKTAWKLNKLLNRLEDVEDKIEGLGEKRAELEDALDRLFDEIPSGALHLAEDELAFHFVHLPSSAAETEGRWDCDESKAAA